MLARLTATLAIVALTACPAKNDDAARDAAPTGPVKTCTRTGQQCEFSPGKLGTCVAKESCDGVDCYTCQSQH